MTSVTHSNWDTIEPDHPMTGVTRRRVIGDAMMVSHVKLDAGFSMPVHAHDNEQIVVVVSGHLVIRSGVDDMREHHLRSGDVLVLPSGVPHNARAIEDTLVLDLFSPVSVGTGLDLPAD